jgi:hypothetical protein
MDRLPPLTCLSSGCAFKHSGGPDGENLAAGSGTSVTPSGAIQMWIDEARTSHLRAMYTAHEYISQLIIIRATRNSPIGHRWCGRGQARSDVQFKPARASRSLETLCTTPPCSMSANTAQLEMWSGSLGKSALGSKSPSLIIFPVKMSKSERSYGFASETSGSPSILIPFILWNEGRAIVSIPFKQLGHRLLCILASC